MKNLLLIENQYLQFINIRTQLSQLEGGGVLKYAVWPETGANEEADLLIYTAFIDQVRIALNPRYPPKLCKAALDNVSAYIEAKGIDFLIIDYKLVGFDKAKNGINLASGLRTLGIQLPVLFFSQTSDDSSDVVDLSQDPFLQPFDWVAKSYSDHELLEENYIAKRVDKKIAALLEKGSDDQLRIDLLGIFAHRSMSDYMGSKLSFFQNNIKLIKEFTAGQQAEIKEFGPRVNLKNADEKRKFILDYEEVIKKYLPK